MRSQSDISTIYPLSVAPAAGWGHTEAGGPTGFVVENIAQRTFLTADNSFSDKRADARIFDDAADAALAAGKLIEASKLKAAA